VKLCYSASNTTKTPISGFVCTHTGRFLNQQTPKYWQSLKRFPLEYQHMTLGKKRGKEKKKLFPHKG